jgi:hypothetical protein
MVMMSGWTAADALTQHYGRQEAKPRRSAETELAALATYYELRAPW